MTGAYTVVEPAPYCDENANDTWPEKGLPNWWIDQRHVFGLDSEALFSNLQLIQTQINHS